MKSGERGDEFIPRVIDSLWRVRERFLRRCPWLSKFIYAYGIYCFIALFFLLYCAISLLKHMNFQSHGWDLGIFDQAVYQYSKLEMGFNTVRLVPVLLGDHFHPSLFLFAPLFWLWNDVRMLLIVQAFITALGAIPIYLIAKEKMNSKFAMLACAFIYLFFWGTMEMVFFDFHPHVLYPPLVALIYYFIIKERMNAYFICLPILLIIQEQVVLTAAMIGVYLIIFKKKWFEGITTVVISCTWFYVVSQKIIPALAATGVYFYNKYYKYLGGGDLIEAAKYLVLHPATALKLLFWPYHKIKLILALLVPFLFLPLFGGFAIIVLPDLLQRLYSSHFPHWELLRHYNAIYAPVLIIATLEALPRVHEWMAKRWGDRKVEFRKLAFAVLLVLALLQVPFTFARSFKTLLDPGFYYLDSRERAGYQALKSIPGDASVCAQDIVVPHLSHRELIYQYDGNTYNAEYVILNKYYNCYPFLGNKELALSIMELYRDPRYELDDFGEGWLVFKLKHQYDIDDGKELR